MISYRTETGMEISSDIWSCFAPLSSNSSKAYSIFDCACDGNIEEIDNFLKQDASLINATDQFEQLEKTVLHYAAEYGHVKLCEYLLDKGADANANAYQKKSIKGFFYGAYGEDVKNWKPLHFACREGRLAVVELFIRRKVCDDYFSKDSQDITPLHLAAIGGHLQVAQTLMTMVEKSQNAVFSPLNHYDDIGMTPLLYCCKFSSDNHVEIASLLLANGANVHAFAMDGNRAIHFAVNQPSDNMLKLLLRHGALKDLGAKNLAYLTPYQIAIQNRRKETLAILEKQDNLINSQLNGH